MNKRPVLLTAACWMSFLASGSGAILFFAMAIFYNFFSEKIISVTNLLSMEGKLPSYFLILASLNAISFAGVVKIWKYIKSGFFFYLFAQIGIMAMPVIFTGWNAFSFSNAIFTLIFAGIYFYFFRKNEDRNVG